MVGWPSRTDPDWQLRQRIRALVLQGHGYGGRNGRQGLEGACQAGACPWWWLRQQVGGRVATVAFRQAVDNLICDGELTEVWLRMPDQRDTAHALLLPGYAHVLPYPVTRARGKADVLAREAWAIGLPRCMLNDII